MPVGPYLSVGVNGFAERSPILAVCVHDLDTTYDMNECVWKSTCIIVYTNVISMINMQRFMYSMKCKRHRISHIYTTQISETNINTYERIRFYLTIFWRCPDSWPRASPARSRGSASCTARRRPRCPPHCPLEPRHTWYRI